jgi:hypothetical protein
MLQWLYKNNCCITRQRYHFTFLSHWIQVTLIRKLTVTNKLELPTSTTTTRTERTTDW